MLTAVLDYYRECLFLLHDHQVALIIFFVVSHILFAILILPCSQFTTLAGVLWGPWVGLVVSMLGAVSSASTTFAIGRGLRDSWFVQRARKLIGSKRLDSLFEIIDRMSWRGVFLIQVNPIVPASTTGYFFGMTSIRFPQFCVTSAIAILPLQIVYVFFGALIHDGTQVHAEQQIALTGIGLIIALCTFFVVKRHFTSTQANFVRETQGLDCIVDAREMKRSSQN